MKTAREQLYDEVTILLAKPADNAASEMKKVMSRYRVQTKPGVDISDGPTARDALGARLIDIWKNGKDDDATRQKMEALIDQFRMQLKGSGSDKPQKPGPLKKLTFPSSSTPVSKEALLANAPSAFKPTAKSEPKPAPTSKELGPKAPARPAIPTQTLGLAEPPARSHARGPEPVAGGPRQRKKARGECPKCKSMGVVLARSYAGDEYYSCIYCGWQAYKPADDDDPNASLALRLLGQTLGSGD